jgi:hypothetical protein
MSAQTRTDAIVSDYRKRLTESQIVVEALLRTDDSAVLQKVLSINADSRILSFEALNGEASINGRVALKVLYVSEQGGCGCLDYNADFSDKIIDGEITPSSALSIQAFVIDTNASGSGADGIKVSCVIEIKPSIIARDNIDCADGEISDVYTRTESLMFNTLTETTKQEFVLTNEVGLDSEVDKICMSESAVHIESVKSMDNLVVLEGKVFTNVVYIPTGGMLSHKQFVCGFSQEIAVLGATADCIIEYGAGVEKWQVHAESFEGEGKTVCTLEHKITAELSCYKQVSKDVIVDAFSVTNELNISAESWELSRLHSVKSLECDVRGTAELSEGMPAADKILAVCGTKINIANCYTDTDRIVVEGLLNTNVIYFNREFENYNSAGVEIPFSVAMPYEGMTGDYRIEVCPCLREVSARGSRTAVDVEATIALKIDSYLGSTAYCLKEIQKGEARKLELNAISIYTAKAGQTLWDVSKELSTTPEILLSQNPNLSSPMNGGERVVIYRQL